MLEFCFLKYFPEFFGKILVGCDVNFDIVIEYFFFKLGAALWSQLLELSKNLFLPWWTAYKESLIRKASPALSLARHFNISCLADPNTFWSKPPPALKYIWAEALCFSSNTTCATNWERSTFGNCWSKLSHAFFFFAFCIEWSQPGVQWHIVVHYLKQIYLFKYNMVLFTIVAPSNDHTVYFDQPIQKPNYILLFSFSLYSSWYNLERSCVIKIKSNFKCIYFLPGHCTLENFVRTIKMLIMMTTSREKSTRLSVKWLS